MNVISQVLGYFFAANSIPEGCGAGTAFDVNSCSSSIGADFVHIGQVICIGLVLFYFGSRIMGDRGEKAIVHLAEAVVITIAVFFLGQILANAV